MATRKRSSGSKLRFLISIAQLALVTGLIWILVKVLAMLVSRLDASPEGRDDASPYLPQSAAPIVLPASTQPEPAPSPEAPAEERDVPDTGVWQCPDGTSGAAFVGSVASDVFHSPECVSVSRIAARTRVCYESRQAAIAYGKRPCGQCSP